MARGNAKKMNPPRRQPLRGEQAKPPSHPPSELTTVPSHSATGLSAREHAALRVFRDFHIASGEMFCFTGPVLEKHKKSLDDLVAKELLVKEHFSSGYSLTPLGYQAMIATRGN